MSSVHDANLRPKTPKKGVEWMYVGGKVQRAESVMINGTRYTDPREPSLPRRKIESNFFITINTNMSFEGAEEEGIIALRKTLVALRDPKELCLALKFGPVDPANYGDDKYADVISKVDWKLFCGFFSQTSSLQRSACESYRVLAIHVGPYAGNNRIVDRFGALEVL